MARGANDGPTEQLSLSDDPPRGANAAEDNDDDQDETEELDPEEVLLDDDGNQIDEEGEIIKTAAELAEEAEEAAADRGDAHDDPDAVVDEEALEAIAGKGGKDTPNRERFNQVYAENKRLTEALAKVPEMVASLVAGKGAAAAPAPSPAPAAYDFDKAQRAMHKAILDGEEDEAAKIGKEIRDEQDKAADARADARLAATLARADVDAVIAESFEKFPFLSDANKDVFQEEVLEDVLMYRDRYIAKGESMVDALQKAVDKVCPAYAKASGGEGGEGGERKPDEEKTPAQRAAEAAARRAKILRNARAAKGTPPPLNQAGSGGRRAIDWNTVDPAKLSDEQIALAPPAIRAKWRGDVA